jgi:hypothetical protein
MDDLLVDGVKKANASRGSSRASPHRVAKTHAMVAARDVKETHSSATKPAAGAPAHHHHRRRHGRLLGSNSTKTKRSLSLVKSSPKVSHLASSPTQGKQKQPPAGENTMPVAVLALSHPPFFPPSQCHLFTDSLSSLDVGHVVVLTHTMWWCTHHTSFIHRSSAHSLISFTSHTNSLARLANSYCTHAHCHQQQRRQRRRRRHTRKPRPPRNTPVRSGQRRKSRWCCAIFQLTRRFVRVMLRSPRPLLWETKLFSIRWAPRATLKNRTLEGDS